MNFGDNRQQFMMPKFNNQPDFLVTHDNKRGRDLYASVSLNTGYAWLLGYVGGGIAGGVTGFKNAPNNTMKVRLNSSLNNMAKVANKYGGVIGPVACFYTAGIWISDHFDLESKTNSTVVTPIFAGAATGLTLSITRGPRAMMVATVLGSAASCVWWYGLSHVKDFLIRSNRSAKF